MPPFLLEIIYNKLIVQGSKYKRGMKLKAPEEIIWERQAMFTQLKALVR